LIIYISQKITRQKIMKKALFLVITSVVLASCGGKTPEGEVANTDTTAVEAVVDTTLVDTTSVPTSSVSVDGTTVAK
jgi:uncharacterized lipoprotein YajG